MLTAFQFPESLMSVKTDMSVSIIISRGDVK